MGFEKFIEKVVFYVNHFFSYKADLARDGITGDMFKPAYYAVAGILLFLVIFCAIRFRKKSQYELRSMFGVLWFVTTGIEIARIIWQAKTGNGLSFVTDLPIYLRNGFMFFMPYVVFGKKDGFFRRSAAAFICTWGLISSAANFLYPAEILSDYPVFSFLGLHTMLYYALTTLIALLMLTSGYYDLKKTGEFFFPLLPIVVLSLPAHLANYLFEADYLFFRGTTEPFDRLFGMVPNWMVWIAVVYGAYLVVGMLFYLPYGIVRVIRAIGRASRKRRARAEKKAAEKKAAAEETPVSVSTEDAPVETN